MIYFQEARKRSNSKKWQGERLLCRIAVCCQYPSLNSWHNDVISNGGRTANYVLRQT